MPARTLNDFFAGFFYADIRGRQEAEMAITWKSQRNGHVKVIKVEGDKGKEVIFHYVIVPQNEKHGMMTIFDGNGTRLISPRKGSKIRRMI